MFQRHLKEQTGVVRETSCKPTYSEVEYEAEAMNATYTDAIFHEVAGRQNLLGFFMSVWRLLFSQVVRRSILQSKTGFVGIFQRPLEIVWGQ